MLRLFEHLAPNGLRYPCWGRDGEAVRPEKWQGVENCLGGRQTPQRRVVSLKGTWHIDRQEVRRDRILAW